MNRWRVGEDRGSKETKFTFTNTYFRDDTSN
jgi:hypothetical protein